jgi:hypothetical protein
MRSLAALLSLCAATVLLCDCSALQAAKQSASDSFHTSFRSSFKTSFIKSCESGGTSEKLCGCVENSFERNYTDDQLMKMAANDPDTNNALAAAARVCAKAH